MAWNSNLRGQVAIEPRCGAAAVNLRAQVAMEYLVTYGWALLALVAVLGVLVSSGLFSGSSFAAQECTFQPDIPCNSFIFYQNSSNPQGSSILEFQISNGLGYPINITGVSYYSQDLGQSGPSTSTDSAPFRLESGKSKNFKHGFNGPAQPGVGGAASVRVGISYLNCKNSPCSGPYNTTGRVSATLQPVG